MKNKNKKKGLIYLLFSGVLLEFFYLKLAKKFKKNKFEKFINKEHEELERLIRGKDDLGEYCKNSTSIFVHYFIPHECNGYRPKILRTKSLLVISVFLIFLKLSVTGYLFFIAPNWAKMDSDIPKEILRLTNEDRIKNNLPPLKFNEALSRAAMAKADDMGQKDYFAHHSPDGKKPWDWIDRSQYKYLVVGENLGMNFITAQSVHTALMESPSHRKNILNDRFEDMGIAVISCTIDGQETNVLVELFSKQKSSTLALENSPTSTAGTTKIAKTEPAPVIKEPIKVLSEEKKETPKPAIIQQQKTTTKPITQPVRKPEPIKTQAVAKIATKTIELAIKPAEKNITATVTPQTVAQNQANFVATRSAEMVSVVDLSPANISPEMQSDILEQKLAKAENELNINSQVKSTIPTEDSTSKIIAGTIKGIKAFYLIVFILVTFTLAINILVRITIQHQPVIIQTLFLIILIVGLATVKFHFIENISNLITIV